MIVRWRGFLSLLLNPVLSGALSLIRSPTQRTNEFVPPSGKTTLLAYQRDGISSYSCRNEGRSCHSRIRMSSLRTFEAGELQLQRYVGELGFIEITDWEYNRQTSPADPDTPSRTLNTSGTTVRLFEAITYANARVVLKEFVPEATFLARKETEISERLLDAWEARYGSSGRPPVLFLLGTLVADAAFKSRAFLEKWVSRFSSLPTPSIGSVYLVYRWEGMYTFASFPDAKQEPEFFDRWNPSLKSKRRATFVKEMMRGAAGALAFMHEAGIVHRSLGAPSLRLNTLDERFPRQVEVLLSDFGFASRLSEIDDETIRRANKAGASTPLAVSDFLFREDLYSLGYVFLELVFGAFCESPTKRPDQNSLKRLLEDIFKGDFRAFKEYCLSEPAWAPAIAVLDEQRGNGWALAASLLGARGGRSAMASGSAVGRTDGAESTAIEGGDMADMGTSPFVSTKAILSLPYFVEN